MCWVNSPLWSRVPGGADSLALAAGAALLPQSIEAAVIDHGLQAGSAQVAEQAATSCREFGLLV